METRSRGAAAVPLAYDDGSDFGSDYEEEDAAGADAAAGKAAGQKQLNPRQLQHAVRLRDVFRFRAVPLELQLKLSRALLLDETTHERWLRWFKAEDAARLKALAGGGGGSAARDWAAPCARPICCFTRWYRARTGA
jgi:hypothetical protein